MNRKTHYLRTNGYFSFQKKDNVPQLFFNEFIL